ncbi:MAG TPA: hypothetical protein VD913_05940 [bacterium]|nr:hypothetical protein [bacterium]
MKIKLLAGLFLFTFMMSPYVLAEENVWDMANSEKYGTKAGGMLGRGLVNVATCFVDIVVHTVEGTQDGPPFVGSLTGLGSGLACGALRVSSGALDVATFWVPGFNGMPVSRSYSNCLEPEDETIQPTTYAAPAPAAAPYAAPAPPQPVVTPAAAPAQDTQSDVYEYVKK